MANLRIGSILATVATAMALSQPASAGCEAWSGWKHHLRFDSDLHNAAIFGVALGAVSGFTDPPDHARWTGDAGFERGLRNTFARKTRSGRDDADDTSDGLLIGAMLAPVVVDVVGNSLIARKDCDQAWNIFAEVLEAYTLTGLLTETTKVIAGRERPFGQECGTDPGYDHDCDDDARNASFFSGHASFAAAGAGILCRNSTRRGIWGDTLLARALPCALGVGGAVTTGLYRMKADKHYVTDVAVGLVVGGLVGFLDIPPVLRLFKSELYEDPSARALGLVDPLLIPTLGRSHVGFQLIARF